jgi:hypothetical protein
LRLPLHQRLLLGGGARVCEAGLVAESRP